jgi:hypothetical protein
VALLVALAGLAVAACGGASHKTFADLVDPGGIPTSTTTSSTVPPTAAATTAHAAAPTPGVTVVAGQWRPATANLEGIKSECGNLSRVAARLDKDQVVVGVAQFGLWGSENGATSWSALGKGPGSAVITNRASAIVFDPAHPDTFWESGIYNGGGIYRTDDDGATFKQLGTIQHTDAMSVDLNDPQRRTMLAGRHETSQLFRSTDGGNTWVEISASLPQGIGFVSFPFVIDSKTFLLGTNHGTNSGILRTTDGGNTWTMVHDGDVVGLPLLTKSDGALYWMTQPGGGVLKSTDGGVSWKQVARDGTLSELAPNIVELPGNRLGAVGNQVVVTSADGGVTWQRLSPTTPFPPAGLTYAPYRHALYIWYFDCDRQQPLDPIKADNVMRLDLGSG